jgi:hypothetical protein
MRQMLRCTGGKAHVSNTGPARVTFCGSNYLRVGINPVNPYSERRDAKCEAAVAAPKVQNALPPYECRATPLPELAVRTRPQSRGHRRKIFADVAYRVRCHSAHWCAA